MRIVGCALAVIALTTSPARAQEAIYLVRHAERADQSSDSPLSAAGETRAASLARVLRDAGITHIFTTDLKRTIDTAAPLAGVLRITPQALPAADVAGVAAKLKALPTTARALVVGHSNTVPEILFALGAGVVTIPDSEHDNLFIVVPKASSTPTFIRIRY